MPIKDCSRFFKASNFLFQSGALWTLLQFLFKYDYTLSESGVEASAETNQQVNQMFDSLAFCLFDPSWFSPHYVDCARNKYTVMISDYESGIALNTLKLVL